MVRNLVLCVALTTGLSRSSVSALYALCRLCGWLVLQAALLEALVLLSGRAQPHCLCWSLAEVSASLWLLDARLGGVEVRLEERVHSCLPLVWRSVRATRCDGMAN